MASRPLPGDRGQLERRSRHAEGGAGDAPASDGDGGRHARRTASARHRHAVAGPRGLSRSGRAAHRDRGRHARRPGGLQLRHPAAHGRSRDPARGLLPWFDVAARQMRQAIVPGAMSARACRPRPADLRSRSRDRAGRPPRHLARRRHRRLRARRGDPARARPERSRAGSAARLQALRRSSVSARSISPTGAARPPALRAAVYRLALEDGELGRRWLADPAVASALAAVDAHLFGGRGDGTVPPAVAGRLTDRVVEARRRWYREAARPAEPSLAADAFGR